LHQAGRGFAHAAQINFLLGEMASLANEIVSVVGYRGINVMADQEQIPEKGKFAVVVDDELRDLIPGYFENRRQDIVLILSVS